MSELNQAVDALHAERATAAKRPDPMVPLLKRSTELATAFATEMRAHRVAKTILYAWSGPRDIPVVSGYRSSGIVVPSYQEVADGWVIHGVDAHANSNYSWFAIDEPTTRVFECSYETRPPTNRDGVVYSACPPLPHAILSSAGEVIVGRRQEDVRFLAAAVLDLTQVR